MFNSLVIWHMQIKYIIEYHYTPIRMAKAKYICIDMY